MKVFVLCLIFATSLFIAGCASTMTPATGWIFTETIAPMAATSNERGTKVGRATCKSVFGLVATGDCSIYAAMKDGGITKISHVDYESFNLLLVYAKMTTVVYGE